MQTILVTGASGGIGKAICKRFSDNGWQVIAQYNKNEPVCCSYKYRADLRSEADINAMVEFALGISPRIDVLVNNAGISQQKVISDISTDDWDDMLNINLRSAFLCSKAILPSMLHYKSGSIINIASMWGQVGASCEVHYSAAKAGLIGMTKAMAKELGPSGIRVNSISPGVIDTAMNSHLSPDCIETLRYDTPLERIGTPEDIAGTVYFLASESSSFITGQDFGVNGGYIIN